MRWKLAAARDLWLNLAMARRRRRRSRRRRRPWLRMLALAVGASALMSLVLVGSLRWVDPPGSAFILRDRIERAWMGAPAPVQRWTRLDAMSPHVAAAIIAAEDQRFLAHGGFDLHELRAALQSGLAGGRLRGASTLSQQLAKNLFLWRERSLVRKGLEAYLTALVEACLHKRRILELYLNVVELGPGVYGVGAASARYFEVPAARLDAHQAALLAAVVPNPRARRVGAPSQEVRRRQRWILGQMAFLRAAGHLTPLARTHPRDGAANRARGYAKLH